MTHHGSPWRTQALPGFSGWPDLQDPRAAKSMKVPEDHQFEDNVATSLRQSWPRIRSLSSCIAGRRSGALMGFARGCPRRFGYLIMEANMLEIRYRAIQVSRISWFAHYLGLVGWMSGTQLLVEKVAAPWWSFSAGLWGLDGSIYLIGQNFESCRILVQILFGLCQKISSHNSSLLEHLK